MNWPWAWTSSPTSSRPWTTARGPSFYVGGDFQMVGPNPVKSIARWNDATTEAMSDLPSRGVREIVGWDDDSGFRVWGATRTNFSSEGVYAWDGTTWETVGLTDWGAEPLAVYDDGSGEALYAGGYFHAIGGSSISHVARWDGASWTPVGPGVSDVDALTVWDEGTGAALYAAVDDRVERWDGVAAPRPRRH